MAVRCTCGWTGERWEDGRRHVVAVMRNDAPDPVVHAVSVDETTPATTAAPERNDDRWYRLGLALVDQGFCPPTLVDEHLRARLQRVLTLLDGRAD